MSRLIDADALESVDFSECTDSMEIMAVIDEQPTAYDSNNVIEQLEDYLFEKYCVEADAKIEEIVKGC